jgi:hypothetical protein
LKFPLQLHISEFVMHCFPHYFYNFIFSQRRWCFIYSYSDQIPNLGWRLVHKFFRHWVSFTCIQRENKKKSISWERSNSQLDIYAEKWNWKQFL